MAVKIRLQEGTGNVELIAIDTPTTDNSATNKSYVDTATETFEVDTKGTVPGPTTADETAGRFLRADGTWAAAAGERGPGITGGSYNETTQQFTFNLNTTPASSFTVDFARAADGDDVYIVYASSSAGASQQFTAASTHPYVTFVSAASTPTLPLTGTVVWHQLTGSQGSQGITRVFFFRRSSTAPSAPTFPSTGTLQTIDYEPTGWTNSGLPTGTDTLYMSSANFNPATGRFTGVINPVQAGATSGPPGADGVTPNITISYTELASSASASVVKGGTNAAPTYDFRIPAPEDGSDGTTPNLTVGTVTNNAGSLTITRRSGSPDTAPIFDFNIPPAAVPVFDTTDNGIVNSPDSTEGTSAYYLGGDNDWHSIPVIPGVFSNTANGLAPQTTAGVNNAATHALTGDGNWTALPVVFTSTANGLVPNPGTGENTSGYYLGGDADWHAVATNYGHEDYRGPWTSGDSYLVGDVVTADYPSTYNTNPALEGTTRLFICVTADANSATSPITSVNWDYLNVQSLGELSDFPNSYAGGQVDANKYLKVNSTGNAVTFVGEALQEEITQWSATATYSIGDIVYVGTGQNAGLYRNYLGANSGSPTTDTTNWQNLGPAAAAGLNLDDSSGSAYGVLADPQVRNGLLRVESTNYAAAVPATAYSAVTLAPGGSGTVSLLVSGTNNMTLTVSSVGGQENLVEEINNAGINDYRITVTSGSNTYIGTFSDPNIDHSAGNVGPFTITYAQVTWDTTPPDGTYTSIVLEERDAAIAQVGARIDLASESQVEDMIGELKVHTTETDHASEHSLVLETTTSQAVAGTRAQFQLTMFGVSGSGNVTTTLQFEYFDTSGNVRTHTNSYNGARDANSIAADIRTDLTASPHFINVSGTGAQVNYTLANVGRANYGFIASTGVFGHQVHIVSYGSPAIAATYHDQVLTTWNSEKVDQGTIDSIEASIQKNTRDIANKVGNIPLDVHVARRDYSSISYSRDNLTITYLEEDEAGWQALATQLLSDPFVGGGFGGRFRIHVEEYNTTTNTFDPREIQVDYYPTQSRDGTGGPSVSINTTNNTLSFDFTYVADGGELNGSVRVGSTRITANAATTISQGYFNDITLYDDTVYSHVVYDETDFSNLGEDYQYQTVNAREFFLTAGSGSTLEVDVVDFAEEVRVERETLPTMADVYLGSVPGTATTDTNGDVALPYVYETDRAGSAQTFYRVFVTTNSVVTGEELRPTLNGTAIRTKSYT